MCIDLMNASPASRFLILDERGKPITPPKWKFTGVIGAAEGIDQLNSCNHVYGKDLIRVKSCCSGVNWVQVNLSRLYHGDTHGGVLSNKQQLEQAFELLTAKLDEISTRRRPDQPDEWKFSLIEIGWNIAKPFRELECRLLSAKHPSVNRAYRHEPGQSINFCGSRFELKVYDKTRIMKRCREINGDAPPTTRVEIVLHNKKLREVTGMTDYCTAPSFDECWGWFRTCLNVMKLEPHWDTTRSTKHNFMHELVARALLDDWTPGGMSALDFILQNASPSKVSRVRKSVCDMRLQLQPWSWDDHFPPTPPPPVQLLMPSPRLSDIGRS